MTIKDSMISLRLPAELLARVDAAAKAEAEATGYKISRNAFIEKSLTQAVAQVEDRE